MSPNEYFDVLDQNKRMHWFFTACHGRAVREEKKVRCHLFRTFKGPSRNSQGNLPSFVTTCSDGSTSSGTLWPWTVTCSLAMHFVFRNASSVWMMRCWKCNISQHSQSFVTSAFSTSSTAFSDVDKGAAVLQSGRKQILKIGKNVPPSLLFDLYPQKVKYCIPLFLFWYFVAGIDTNCKDKALFC